MVKEGFVTVAISWVLMSLIGCLPFIISGEIPSFTNAFFETVSGFTTTGASILENPELMSHGMLFWRSFTHWVGGMGVLVFVLAILPTESGRSIHLMRAEMPGPVVGKLLPKARSTAKTLYLIYIVLTLIEVSMLLFGGMSLFDSFIHTFGTAGTGGFSSKATSLAGYSPYIQWVVTGFMILFGINFNLFFLVLMGKPLAALRSRELWVYLGIIAASITAIVINLTTTVSQNIGENIRMSAFQVASIISTTGYSTADYNAWPAFSKTILIILMFLGACAGSTAGGLKISRVILLLDTVKKDLKKTLHPRSVAVVKMEGKKVDEQTISNAGSYFIVYIVIFAVICLLISLEHEDFETAFTATCACFNNVGPGLSAVGPASNYGEMSTFSKFLLSGAMLFGRLEIYPLLFALSPKTWTKK